MLNQSISKILLVEDETAVAFLLEIELEEVIPGVNITRVESAEAALELLSRESFDLVVSDNDLQGRMKGKELWSSCRREHPTTPFILMSGSLGEMLLASLPDSESRPVFMQKPFSVESIRAALSQALLVLSKPQRS